MRLWVRQRRALFLLIASLSAIVIVLYASTLIAQAVSARRASAMLDALEAVRIGDPASTIERAVPQCTLKQMEEMYHCEIFAGWGRWQWQGAMARIPSEYYLPIIWRLRRTGVQPWYISVSASISDGQIRNLQVLALVVGGRKSLGAEWELNDIMPQRFIESSQTPDQQRTYLGGYSITSLPGGVGIRIAVTPDSTPQELRARRINRACLRSFNRCDELCKLLPDVIPILDSRGRNFADCASDLHNSSR
jgi:hypothetical protein